MKKKLLSLTLVLAMALTLMPTVALAEDYTITVGKLEVTEKDGTLTITLPVTVEQSTTEDPDENEKEENKPGTGTETPSTGTETPDPDPNDEVTDETPASLNALASESATVDLFSDSKTAGALISVSFTITLPDGTAATKDGSFSSTSGTGGEFTCKYEAKASGEYTVAAKIVAVSDVVLKGNTAANTTKTVKLELKNIGKFSNCLWEKGYVYWEYTPGDSSVTVSTSKFHIKVDSMAVTPFVTSATFTVSGSSVSGYKFPLEQTSSAQKVEVYYDTETANTGSCAVPALEVDTSKAIDPTDVKYESKTGALSWTMKDITASTAVSTANDDFYVEFRTKAGKSAASTIQLKYVPSGSSSETTAANPISISGSTYSATVSQPTTLDEGAEYVISVQNRNRSNRTEYTFTAVGVSQLVLALPKASEVTSSNVDSVIKQLGDIGVNTLAAAMVNKQNVQNFSALSQAVGKALDLTTTKSVATNANAAFLDNQSKIQMEGAQNSATQTGATLRLEVGPSEKSSELLALPLESGYENADKVTFSMTLTQTKGNDTMDFRSLSVPVLVTLPVPENISMKNVEVLHYNTRGVYDSRLVTTSITNSTRTITVAVTGFSDFVITGNTTVDNTAVSTDTITDSTPKPSAPSGFPDVPASSTFAAPIAWAQQNGILGGYSDGTFRPNNSTTRQALWMVLARMSGASPASMAEARTWSMNSGVSDGTNPQNPLTRQQLITMLYRFAQQQGKTISGSADLSGYSDNSAVANYAREALAWGVGNGIITGTNDGRLNPQGTATRAHFAAFLYRYANL